MKTNITKITRGKLQELMSSGKEFRLIDVLAHEHFEKEHIKGAVSLPVDEIRERAESFLDKEGLIIVYCASFDCKASTTAAKILTQMGYKNVLDYKGGLKDYKEAGLPLEGSLHEKPSQVCTCSACHADDFLM